MVWPRSPAVVLVTLSASAAQARRPHASVKPLMLDAGLELHESRPWGHSPIAREGAWWPSGSGSANQEHLFLDLSLCFNQTVDLVGVDFFVANVTSLHSKSLRWHILHPIPSRGEVPTQWFRLQEAWHVLPPEGDAKATFPVPGAYRSTLNTPLRLVFGDCIGWSVAGEGPGPFASAPGGEHYLSWVKSTSGLHDAVELFVKRGTDPTTSLHRAAPQIGWTGLEPRTTSLQLRFVPVAQPKHTHPPQPEGPAAPVVAGGNPACWRHGYTFEACCGQDALPCWDTVFTFERCCTLTTAQRFMGVSFTAPTALHYDLPHLQRGNLPRLGPLQDDEALLLYGLTRALRPRTIVEFGTANGFSGMNWMYAIADDSEARVFSYDILPYPAGQQLEDSDPRFVFLQKSQADFEPSDVDHRPVDIAFFDAGHLLEYSLQAFERLLPALSPTAVVAVHDTGLHVLDFGAGAPPEEEGQPFTEESCASREGGADRCHRYPRCEGDGGHCVGRAHRPSERQFVREVLRRWTDFRPLFVQSRRVFRHGLTLLQRGKLWDRDEEPFGEF